ncbi:unnamed protein product [Calypogeia fissa]
MDGQAGAWSQPHGSFFRSRSSNSNALAVWRQSRQAGRRRAGSGEGGADASEDRQNVLIGK